MFAFVPMYMQIERERKKKESNHAYVTIHKHKLFFVCNKKNNIHHGLIKQIAIGIEMFSFFHIQSEQKEKKNFKLKKVQQEAVKRN